MALKMSENPDKIIWTVTFWNFEAPLMLKGPDEKRKCGYSWQSSGASLPGVFTEGFWNELAVFQMQGFAFCIVVSQCHGRISSSADKRLLVHFPYFLLYMEAADPGTRTAGGREWEGNSRTMTQTLLRSSYGHPNLQEAYGL